MKNEIVFLLEPDRGSLTVETARATPAAVRVLRTDIGDGVVVNCGRPADRLRGQEESNLSCHENAGIFTTRQSIYVYRLYHFSMVDGPGRRSVVQVSGCSIRCQGCYVPETHEQANGLQTPIGTIVDEIKTKRDQHDGVTILGGEPFDQPVGIAGLVSALKYEGMHIIVYTGYTLETLTARNENSINSILKETDVLIEGPFVRELAKGSDEYRGSRNQRLITITGRRSSISDELANR